MDPDGGQPRKRKSSLIAALLTASAVIGALYTIARPRQDIYSRAEKRRSPDPPVNLSVEITGVTVDSRDRFIEAYFTAKIAGYANKNLDLWWSLVPTRTG